MLEAQCMRAACEGLQMPALPPHLDDVRVQRAQAVVQDLSDPVLGDASPPLHQLYCHLRRGESNECPDRLEQASDDSHRPDWCR